MFRRTLNVQVSQNVISSRFWATLNLKEIWTHLFSNSPHPHPPKKLFWCPCPRFRHLLWDIRTFRFWQSHMLEYSNTFSFLAPSECNQYKILNDSDRHSDFGRGDRKCDKNLTEDWYRFSAGAGTSIPTHCLPHHRCGTDLPGWMNGTHPTVDEGVVSRKVCFSGYQNCCHHHIMINVQNCSSFVVYRLKPVQVCASRYCGKS